MQPSSFLPDKAHDIGRLQMFELYFAIPRVLSEEPSSKRQIVNQGCWRKPAFLFQITPEFRCQPLGRRGLDQRCLGHDALLDELAQQPLQNRRITGSEMSALRSILQIAGHAFCGHLLHHGLAPV